MSVLDPVRRALRMLAWAAALGLLATVLHSLIALQAAPALVRIASRASSEEGRAVLAQALSGLLLALLAFAVVWLASRLIELPFATGAAAGAFAALLPVLIVVAVENDAQALGPPSLLAVRGGTVLLAAVASGLAAGRAKA